MDVLVMDVVAEDVVHAGVSGDVTGREEGDEEEGDTVKAVDVGRRTAGAPPTGRRCSNGDSDRGGKAAVGPAPLAGSRQCTAAPLNPPRRRSLLHRRGDSDPPYRHPDPGGRTAEIRMATVKYATGATAPVAQLPLRRLDSEPASSWKPLSRWAGWRSEGDRPPAQRESQNYRRGLSTAER
ncbi:hypothetical protein NDU88_002370 [Pleurodeles waltl]|uniref:Uncharacterized protein n=1 Tax=Pleurodeles waltl TaxID=8319 RepID=A0AAV7NF91_PLEWA|nr:hypothetical protein NDU88_002370 [Pleurodeles waltl]